MDQVILKNKSDDSFIFTSESNKFVVGRGEKADCVIAVQGVSKTHAEFIKNGSNWYIRDLGSTNGTYLNSESLSPGELYIVRPKDELSFATHECYIAYAKYSNADPSLSVFQEDVYQGEFFIGLNTSFTYGGLKATIPAKEPNSGELILLVKREGANLVAVQKYNDVRVLVNGSVIDGRVTLTDRDKITIADLVFIVSIQVPLTAEQTVQRQIDEAAPIPEYLKGRIGEDGWGAPTNKRANAGTLLSVEQTIQDESKRLNTSATGLGVNRFSTTRLRIQEANKKKDKTELILGFFAIISSFIMASVLIFLYGF